MGTVEAIFTAHAKGAPTERVLSVVAMAGVGLAGDRYAADEAHPARQVTFIEAEALDAARAEHGLDLEPGEHRRNIVTRGVALDDLLDREFTVGDVRLRGVKRNEPCAYLQDLTGKPVLKGLLHRGGLRAEILSTGTIKVGDEIGH